MTDHFRDPVCGMDVTPENAACKSEVDGNTYYFCALSCKDSFDRDPERYLSQVAPAGAHSCC